ncbi:MAG: ATP-binding protein [Candidatus Binatia bacterium]
MGLGLFLSRTVVEQLEGELHIDSAPGRGTSVAIVLPRRGPATIRRIAGGGFSPARA